MPDTPSPGDDTIYIGTIDDTPFEVDPDEFDDLQAVADATDRSLDRLVQEMDDVTDLIFACLSVKATLKEWRDDGMTPSRVEVERAYETIRDARAATPDLPDDHLYADLVEVTENVEACLFEAEHLLHEIEAEDISSDSDDRETVRHLLFGAGITLEGAGVPDLDDMDDDHLADNPTDG